ncbi:SirB2 family protein [Piscinibacter gummiphilus]|uniref:Invasion activity up-regulator n=1 Tax=Piscinibacter gummiphilus TaxID=946333 RepID=A0A1W6LBY8_9BURK|nr:SirB2 family protein [Piscinibacter gummiphilus]ARN21774.1 invasion activity up-regulator [Piscinibacter gummiphilus]ATU66458.1 invasion activity up-regulator [Piscinibacter gummiphilus]GLS95363.1 hypothetical protein GCM10007918_26550 [Piscinibacter gummiphilus]
MALAEFYPAIKASHVGLVMLSGTLFTARGLGVLLGGAWPLAPLARRGSQVIDTALLAAALLLLATLHLNPFTTPWLATKLGLLVAYIGFGTFALKRASTRAGKAVAFAVALLCFGAMVAIARTHDPLGFLRFLGA